MTGSSRIVPLDLNASDSASAEAGEPISGALASQSVEWPGEDQIASSAARWPGLLAAGLALAAIAGWTTLFALAHGAG